MTIVLREMTRDAADAILAGERPGGVRVADDYPTEFSAGVAQHVGAVGQFGPYFLQRPEDDLVVGEIGGAFVDEEGTIEIGYAVVESQWNRGYATAAVEALVTKASEASEVRRIVAHTPLERPESGRVSKRRASRWCERPMMRTRTATSCASANGSWRSSSAAHVEPLASTRGCHIKAPPSGAIKTIQACRRTSSVVPASRRFCCRRRP
jgi:hypothetical protein